MPRRSNWSPTCQPSRWPAWVAALAAAIATAQAAPPDLFDATEPLALRIEAPFATVARQRENPEYHPAKLVAADERGTPITVDLRVRVRGKSRAETCDFPPLLLNFPGKQPAGSPFAEQNRLKLVTHCKGSGNFEQYVRVERQLYRALALLTAESLRTRLVTVSYYDSERGRELVTKPGFLIEDESRFARRSGFTTVDAERVDPERYDQGALALVDLFQYFVGNTDWSAAAGPAGQPCCHNVVPFARADGTLVPVPYDFDATGIVNAPYTQPDARLPIQTVRERLYRGRCRDLAALQPTLDRFVAQRAAIGALFTVEQGLDAATVKYTQRYIDEFYTVIGDAKRAQRALLVNCPR